MRLFTGARIGALIAVSYVLTAVATMQLGSRHVRPLFEGFTPPPPYQWVNPPPEFRAGNQKPSRTQSAVTLGPNGSSQTAVNTQDAQLGLNLAEGAFPAHRPDTSVALRITPLDPATLGAMPPGFSADGNAYRVQATFMPSRQAAVTLSKPGNVFLFVPQAATALLFSSDGKVWQQLDAQQTGGTGAIAASFEKFGYFVAAMPAGSGSPPSNTTRVILMAALTVGGCLLLLLGPSVWLRWRAGRAPASSSPPRPGQNRKKRRRKARRR